MRLDLSMQYSGMPPTPEPSEAGDKEGEDQEEGEAGEVDEGAAGDQQEGEGVSAADQGEKGNTFMYFYVSFVRI